jgi:hypothetical protein
VVWWTCDAFRPHLKKVIAVNGGYIDCVSIGHPHGTIKSLPGLRIMKKKKSMYIFVKVDVIARSYCTPCTSTTVSGKIILFKRFRAWL